VGTMTKRVNPDYDPALDEPQWLDTKELAEKMCVVQRTAMMYMRKLREEGHPLVRAAEPKRARPSKTKRAFLRMHIAAVPDLEDALERWVEEASEAKRRANERRWANTTPEERAESSRRWQRGKGPRRDVKGEAHNRAVLTNEDVIDVRAKREQGWPYRELIAHFGMSESQLRRIIRRESWAHVG